MKEDYNKKSRKRTATQIVSVLSLNVEK